MPGWPCPVDNARTIYGNQIDINTAFVTFYETSGYPAHDDNIAIKGKISSIHPQLNPGGFDFQQYAKRQNVFHQISIQDWYVIKSSSFYGLLHKIQTRILHQIESYAPDTYSISAAMLLGDKSALTDREESLFKTSGLMHLLVVSGLHAGLFFGIIWLFFYSNNSFDEKQKNYGNTYRCF